MYLMQRTDEITRIRQELICFLASRMRNVL